MKPTEAAILYGVCPRTISRWCKAGLIPCKSKRFGKKITYEVYFGSTLMDKYNNLIVRHIRLQAQYRKLKGYVRKIDKRKP